MFQTANQLRWQAVTKMRTALAEGAISEADLLFEPRSGLLSAADFVPRTYATCPRPVPRETATPVSPALVPQYVRAFPPVTVVYPGCRRLDVALRATISGLDPRVTNSMLGAAYEVTPPRSVRPMMPLGMQVLACYWEGGLRMTGARRLKIRLDNSVSRLRSFACTPLPEQQSENSLYVSFGRTGAHARLELAEGKVDALFLFLPPGKML